MTASCWFASADATAQPMTSEYERIALGPMNALELLQDADRTANKRLNDLDGLPFDVWPGGELRIYIEDGADLLDFHRAVHQLMSRLAIQGRRAGVRLEVRW